MSEPTKETPNKETVSDTEEPEERCHCGYNRHHHMVSPLLTYTAWRSFLVILAGVSAAPIRVDFQCRICKERFDFTVDPDELQRYI